MITDYGGETLLYINEKLIKNPENAQKIRYVLDYLENDIGFPKDRQRKDQLLLSIKTELHEELAYDDIIKRLNLRPK